MNLPNHITIGGRRWKVVEVSELKDKDGENLGETLPHKFEIRILKSDKNKWQTLFHEAIHAALYMGGWGEKLGEDEESVVLCIDNLMWPWINKLRKE